MIKHRLSNFVPRFKKTQTTMSCMGDMMLDLDLGLATEDELRDAVAQVHKSKMPEHMKAKALALIDKPKTWAPKVGAI